MAKTVSQKEFLAAAREHLAGLPLLALLTNIEIKTDEKGNILPDVVENIQKFFRVASRMTPDEVVKEKCQKMLVVLGTNSFSPVSGGFAVFGKEEDMNRLKRRDEILEQFKKEKGIDNPEKLQMTEFLAFRKELFERYKQAGV